MPLTDLFYLPNNGMESQPRVEMLICVLIMILIIGEAKYGHKERLCFRLLSIKHRSNQQSLIDFYMKQKEAFLLDPYGSG